MATKQTRIQELEKAKKDILDALDAAEEGERREEVDSLLDDLNAINKKLVRLGYDISKETI